MKTFKKFIAILIFILCFIIIQGCQGPEELKIFIGEDGNWYINNTNSGMSSVGKDGVDGKSAYEIAVENGYNGSIEDWLTELQGKDGSLNVYDKDNNEHIDSEIEIVNNKILLTVTKTETITIETGTVNEIAYEELSFKNIFEDNNDAPINMSTYNSANDTYGDYSGKTTIQNEDYVTAPSAMYVTGTVSQQAKSSKSYSGTFYIASKVKCTRYEKGYLGIVFGSDASKYKNTTLQEQFDEEYLTCSSIETLDADSIFIGSAISANLDGYIDDPVVINMSIFKTMPNIVNMNMLYEKYIKIINGQYNVETKTEDITTTRVFLLGETTSSYTNFQAKTTFMNYMNEKASNIGMTKTKFVDAAGFYNTTTAYDLLKMGVYACSYDALVDAWHKNTYTVTITGNNPRSEHLTTTVAGSALENYYFLFGGKTGTVDGQVNLLAVVEGPDERLFCVVVLGCDDNRFQAAKEALDIAMIKYKDPNADVSGYDVPCKSAAVCVVPMHNTKAYTDYQLNVLYSKDMYSLRTPASITKVMTSICMLDFVSDINESFMINDTDITSGSGNIFVGGDIITFREALHAMMLPSSNTAAEATATAAGHKILEYKNK